MNNNKENKDVMIRAIFNPISEKFELQVGELHLKLDVTQFARMMEYLSLVWNSYVNRDKK